MYKRLLIFSVVILTLIFPLQSQKATLKGQIHDLDNSDPLIGVSIQINDLGTISDELGNYEIELDPGHYTVIFSYVGFRKKEIDVKMGASAVIELNVELEITNVLLEEATITGSKYEQRVAESTISVDIVRASLIESVNAISADDVLDKVSGVQILDDQANIRGGSGWSYGAGSRVMVLIDDMPALQADAGLPQWSDIPIENISQIEVVKGAASALYGSSALNGIINVRTAYATSEPVTKLSIFHHRYFSPSDESKKWWDVTPFSLGLSLLHRQKFGKLDLVLGGYYFKQDSAHAFKRETFRRKSRLNFNLRYRITDRLSIGANSFFNDGYSSSFFIWLNGTTGAYLPFPGAITRSSNFRYIIDPYLVYYDKKNNKHKIQSRYYHINNENNLNQSNASDLYYLEYQYQRKFNSGITLTAGAVGTWLKSDSELFSDTIITGRNYATYLQMDMKLYDKLNVTLGTRYEYNRQNTPRFIMGHEIPDGKLDEGKLIGRLGLNYELNVASFLRASIGQGYRYPTITERFIRTTFSGFTVFPNVELESETGWSAELGLKQGFRLLNLQGFLDLAFFWSEYSNMMEFNFHMEDGISGFQSQNVGDTEIRGFEISMASQAKLWEIPLRIYGGYTYIDPKYSVFTEQLRTASSVDFNILKYRTKHQINIDIEAEWKGFVLGATLTGASHMIAIDEALGAFATINQYRSFNNNGYRKFDVRIAYTFDHWKLSLLCNNILNEEYTERPGILEAPKNLGLRLDLML